MEVRPGQRLYAASTMKLVFVNQEEDWGDYSYTSTVKWSGDLASSPIVTHTSFTRSANELTAASMNTHTHDTHPVG